MFPYNNVLLKHDKRKHNSSRLYPFPYNNVLLKQKIKNEEGNLSVVIRFPYNNVLLKHGSKYNNWIRQKPKFPYNNVLLKL